MIHTNSVQDFCDDLEAVAGPFSLTVGSENGAYSASIVAKKGTPLQVTGACTAGNARTAMLTAVRDVEFKLATGVTGEAAPVVYGCGCEAKATLSEKLEALMEKLNDVVVAVGEMADEAYDQENP